MKVFNSLLEKVTDNPALLSTMIKNQGDVERSTAADTLPGTVFLVKTKRLRGNPPKGEVGYSEADHDGDDEFDDYDGRHFWTTERLIFSISPQVRGRIMQQQRATILYYWGVVDAAEFAKMGSKVEDLFLADLLCADAVTTMKSQELKHHTADPHIAEDVFSLPAGRNSRRGLSLENVGTIFDSGNEVAGMADNTALIDGAGPGKQVEQVTVSDDHSFKQPALICLLKSAGFLEENKGILRMIDAAADDKLKFYWVCPPARYAKWKKRTAKTILTGLSKKENMLAPGEKKILVANKAMLKQCLDARVVQYALEMPYTCPHQSSD
eukprot:scaffold103301_cov71-Attheya_sp.AAC.2